MRGTGLRAHAEALLTRHWWQTRPTPAMRALRPLAWLYGRLAARRLRDAPPAPALPVPLVVVGNFVAGGAGKTPTVVAVVRELQAAGHRPGVVSRGYGGHADGVAAVDTALPAAQAARQVGDEPLLIARSTGVPVWVGRDRPAAALALCAANPQVDVLVSDDGLQHAALDRRAELVVFDERGSGNGLLLPAGPLRTPLPARLPDRMRVLYTSGRASTPLPGALARRTLGAAWPLAAWHAGDGALAAPLESLRGRRLLAMAALAAPEKFFSMLEARGLAVTRLPLPDHDAYAELPWQAGDEVVTTEKDAVKLDPARVAASGARVWVVPLDLQLPAALVGELTSLLFAPPAPRSP